MLSRKDKVRLIMVSFLSTVIFVKFAPVLIFDLFFYVLSGADAWSSKDQSTMLLLNLVLFSSLVLTYFIGKYKSNLKWWMVLGSMIISPIAFAYIYSLFV